MNYTEFSGGVLVKKLVAVLTLFCILIAFVACQGAQTEDNAENNASVSTPTAGTVKKEVVVSTDSFPENTVIQVEKVKDVAKVENIITTAKIVEVYDINATLNSEKIQPDGKVEVSFPIPAGYNSNKHIIEVYYISDDGKSEKIDATVAQEAVVAKLEHFSVYAVVITEKPSFNLAVDADYAVVDGNKALVSDNNLTFTFDAGDTWRTFVEKNKATGFLIDKDFYGKKDIVYYVHNGTRYQIVFAIGLTEVKPDDEIDVSEYACQTPHRETLQGQWFYEVENGPFYCEDGSLDWFDRQGKTIIVDIHEKTYVVKHIKLKKLTANSYTIDEQIIASGKYTSSDGDNLGSTLTFDNGCVIETTRSDSYIATLFIDGKSITIKTENLCRFYEFG